MFRELILFAIIGSTLARSFYRRDYQYFHEFGAFYKFHWDDKVVEWDNALTKCSSEGATLFYPAIAEELAVVTNLTAAAPQYDARQIWVGIQDEFQVGEFMTVDGLPFPILKNETVAKSSKRRCVILDISTKEYEISNCSPEESQYRPHLLFDEDGTPVIPPPLPPLLDESRGFICKRTIPPADCPTIDKGYVFKRETNKCYNFHNQLKPWNEAYEQCYKEGAMLVVPETSEEFQVIIRLAQSNDNPRDNRYGRINNRPDAYFIGIHKRGQEFFTTKGVSMASEGVYQRWYDGNDGQSPHANCVAIDDVVNNNDLYYKTEDCFMHLRFICEMKV